MNIDIFVEQWMGPESLDYYYIDWVVKEVKRLHEENERLKDIVEKANGYGSYDKEYMEMKE
tara:strand:- start:265 stop:447 length:183 start_codon:yes stop_codon:yes gene_type:complete